MSRGLARGRAGAGRGRRPLAFVLHSLFGLKLSLFVLFVCLTGTLAVVSDEIEWLYRPEVRATATGDGSSWGVQLAAARRAYPQHAIGYATAGEEPYLATRFHATDPAGERRVIYVDPSDGRVTGESSWIGLRSVLRALHHYLFVPGDAGFYAVAALGPVSLASLATGLLLYKKFWRGFLRLPRRGRGARVFWGDLHRLVGLWSAWFVLVIAVTSVWYLVERPLYRAGIDFDPPRPRIGADTAGRMPEPLPLDTLVDIAERALPGLTVGQIWLPGSRDEPMFLLGQAGPWLVRDRAAGVEVDPYAGTVLALRRPEAMSLAARWSHTADPLHFGDFGGLASKLAWSVLGLAMCLSVASGAAIHAGRTARSVAPLLIRLDGLGLWKWPNLLAVTVVPALALVLSWLAAP